jgi:ABC-2 type transport system permease protein
VFGNDVELDPVEDVWRGVGPSDYYVPAYLGLVMAATGVLSMPVRLASYRERGVLRRFRASAMPLWAILGSQIAIALLTAVVGAVSITVASTLIYGTELLPADGLVFIPAFVLASLAFAASGVLLGSVLPTSRSAQGVGIMLFFVMFLLSGSGPPRDVLTGPMRGIGNTLPLSWVITLLQDPWLGFGWATTASLVVVGVLVGSVALSVRFFRWD